MKKLNFLVMTLLLLAISNSYGQSKDMDAGPTCTTCNDSKDRIQNNGDGTFTADSAQAYYWKICSGTATISGSNTSQTITVSGAVGSTSRIMLTRFANGICYEACEEFTIPIVEPTCDNCVNVTVLQNSPNLDCDSGYATILPTCSNYSDIISVEWSWGLVGTPCGSPSSGTNCPLNTATSASNNFKSSSVGLASYSYNDPSANPQLQFYATINYVNGECSTFGFENLVCANANGGSGGGPGPGGLSDLSFSPNPTTNGSTITFQGVDHHQITTIEVLDMAGNGRSGGTPSDQTFDIGNLTPGIYIVQFTSVTNEVVQKKLVIE